MRANTTNPGKITSSFSNPEMTIHLSSVRSQVRDRIKHLQVRHAHVPSLRRQQRRNVFAPEATSPTTARRRSWCTRRCAGCSASGERRPGSRIGYARSSRPASATGSRWRRRDRPRDFHRLPAGAWASGEPAPVDRPWESLRAPARGRIPVGELGGGAWLLKRRPAGPNSLDHRSPITESPIPPQSSSSSSGHRPQDQSDARKIVSSSYSRHRCILLLRRARILHEAGGL